MSVATPRPASTVVVLRESDDAPIQVLMVRRNDTVAFMAGAYVFPGGRVDDADRAVAPPAGHASRFGDLAAADDWAYRVAAARELVEEANVRVDAADLVPIAHWVTPEIEIRRYDTRFFLVRMPEGQSARHDEGEMTALAWLAPHEAIRQCLARQIQLPPPTWTTLRQLEAFGSVDEAIARMASRPIVRVMPGFIREGGQTMLTLPGDPLYPTLPGWEVPEDTRFLLEEGGGWRPVPA